ncbi:MAG: UvrD-helicase domain-containing protein [Rhodoferax sp.]|nr:UvrD-helicase domain-containing protein [Rhodoferax sp.]MDP3654633.1 UvrD-helicase domain-containing protein [Rhodoferax sp.]
MSDTAAFEHNGVTVARQRFYEIACDPRRSVAVEACAGAGKTWMLVSRMVRALLEGSAPQEILAITFTKKAAGEMRQRLLDWLLQFAQATDATLRQELQTRGLKQEPTPEQLSTLRQLHATLLQSGRPVQIRTFHSWFAALLRSAPLAVLQELGLPTAYELLENDAKAVAQVWRRFQTRVAQDTQAHEDYLAAVSTFGRHQAHKALEAALNKRVEFVLADAQGVVDQSVQTFAQQFPDFAGMDAPQDRLAQPAVRQLLLESARALGASSLVTCTKAASALEQGLTQNDHAGICDALLTKTGTPRKFSEKLSGIATVQQAQELLVRMAQAQAQHAACLHQQRMARLVRGLVDDYAALKRERGWIDMGDLERAALTLMSDPVLSGWVQERLDARVRHLLIDEFQDTNPLQWQALSAWLTGYTGAGQAPSVFIVGDPKQSIYRFRRAEPQVFKAAKEFVVEGLGGDVLSCDHTRRNAPPIIALVNQVMGQAQTQGEFDGYRAHSTESTQEGQVFKLPRIAREPKDAPPVPEGAAEGAWRNSLTTPRQQVEETRKTLECRQAAQWLAQQLQAAGAQLKPRDIMVLARKRERLGLMQAELAALRIPAQQPEKNELADMPEVQDLVALLDVLVSPRHDLSLARVLKSPLFGVNDADLVQLVLRQRVMAAQVNTDANIDAGTDADALPEPAPAKPTVTWLQVLQEAADLPEALAPLGQRLGTWKQWVDSVPPHDALNAIYQDGDVLARYAAATPPNQRDAVLANLRALLSAALQVDGGRYVTAYALVRALRAGGLAAPVRADTDAVRLLTIHGAKGLEAPLVLLLDTDGEALKSETMGVLVNWPGEDAYPRRFVFLASESRPPACVAEALAVEQAERSREELNALYVALTRTQRTLVVSSLEPHSPNPGSWWQRLETQAQDAPWQAVVGAVAQAVPLSADVHAEVRVDDYLLKILPNRPPAITEYAQAAIKLVADAAPDSLDSRIGQAMHRLLEWVQPAAGGVAAASWLPEQWAAVAQDFALDTEQVNGARHMAHTILNGQGAWAWDSQQLGWHGNEVAMAHRGRMLRLDRLVQHRTSQEWWVLDYKSSAQPEQQADLRAQLLAYRAAVALAYPGQAVRAAFLTAQGALVELVHP